MPNIKIKSLSKSDVSEIINNCLKPKAPHKFITLPSKMNKLWNKYKQKMKQLKALKMVI